MAALPSSSCCWLLIVLTAAASTALGVGGPRALDGYVRHFESLHYDTDLVYAEHLRHRRSLPEDEHKLRIDFHAHGRPFQLELERDHTVFHDQLVVHDADDNELSHIDTSHIYHGKLIGEPNSHCFGSVRDGVFDGQISTGRDGLYYVERIQRFTNVPVQPEVPENRTVHSVIYHEEHITDPYRHPKHAGHSHPGCGATPEVNRWMENIQNSAVEEQNQEQQEDSPPEPMPQALPRVSVKDETPEFKYSAAANDPWEGQRVRRALENPNKRKSCSLYIQTDPLFWRHIRDMEPDDAKTEEEILSLIAQHVKAVNRIYSDTPFDGKYKHNGYQFEVQRIKIHNDSQCKSSGNVHADRNPFCIPNVDVSNFLNLHSKSNHEEFCLAYVFTYRDFTGGTLGLAWVASASGASGGICETYKRYTENIDGVHHTQKRSLNTGIITFVNYNSRVPPKVSQLTLAHEIGHNFGSPHDWPQECRPGGIRGNYIMFASATSGDQDNNNKFSHCSKANISAVLDAITDNRKPNCFTESDGAFCGNKIVEEGEECDCGFDDNECAEQCCFPRRSKNLSEEENKRNRCKRRPGKECSPSEGPCCNTQCRYVKQWETLLCKNEDDCTRSSVCNGRQATCPRPDYKPDNVTECNEGTQVCQSGECTSSICVKYGLESCFLTSDLMQDKRELCELACRQPGNNHTCMSTRELVERGDIRDVTEGLSLRPGSPCDNFQGYCDVFLKCRKVDAEGPLVRLKNLLFNQETLLTIMQYVTEYWWAVLLLCIASVILMGIFLKCCAIHTPSSNPNMPKNLHFSETLRRPARALQKQGAYVGSWVIQNNVPPKVMQGPGNQDQMEQNRAFQYRQANSGNSGHGAPPPYPGRGGSSGSSGGPGHGYGEGRGHYNRSGNHERSSRSHHSERSAGGSSSGGGGGHDRRSGYHRSSRIEMQPMR